MLGRRKMRKVTREGRGTPNWNRDPIFIWTSDPEANPQGELLNGVLMVDRMSYAADFVIRLVEQIREDTPREERDHRLALGRMALALTGRRPLSPTGDPVVDPSRALRRGEERMLVAAGLDFRLLAAGLIKLANSNEDLAVRARLFLEDITAQAENQRQDHEANERAARALMEVDTGVIPLPDLPPTDQPQ